MTNSGKIEYTLFFSFFSQLLRTHVNLFCGKLNLRIIIATQPPMLIFEAFLCQLNVDVIFASSRLNLNDPIDRKPIFLVINCSFVVS